MSPSLRSLSMKIFGWKSFKSPALSEEAAGKTGSNIAAFAAASRPVKPEMIIQVRGVGSDLAGVFRTTSYVFLKAHKEGHALKCKINIILMKI